MLSTLSRLRPVVGQPGSRSASSSSPDPAFAAIPRLTDLCARLVAARKPLSRRSLWAEPPVFFFNLARQAELEAARPVVRSPDPTRDELTNRIRAELAVLCRSVEVRRVARAVPGLKAAAEALAAELSAARELAELLAVPDDEVVLVLHPGARVGFRLHVRGVTDLAQFQILLLDTVMGSTEGLLPGAPIPSRFRTVCRDADPVVPAGVPMVADMRYQFFKPTAVGPDGSVPGGFQGCDHWLWGREPLAAVPRVDGERVVILGAPAYHLSWEIERRFPSMAADVRLMQVLTNFEVVERLGRFAGRSVPSRVEAERPVPVCARAA